MIPLLRLPLLLHVSTNELHNRLWIAGEHALKNLFHAMNFKKYACDKGHNNSYLVKHTFTCKFND